MSKEVRYSYLKSMDDPNRGGLAQAALLVSHTQLNHNIHLLLCSLFPSFSPLEFFPFTTVIPFQISKHNSACPNSVGCDLADFFTLLFTKLLH